MCFDKQRYSGPSRFQSMHAKPKSLCLTATMHIGRQIMNGCSASLARYRSSPAPRWNVHSARIPQPRPAFLGAPFGVCLRAIVPRAEIGRFRDNRNGSWPAQTGGRRPIVGVDPIPPEAPPPPACCCVAHGRRRCAHRFCSPDTRGLKPSGTGAELCPPPERAVSAVGIRTAMDDGDDGRGGTGERQLTARNVAQTAYSDESRRMTRQ